MPKIICLVKYYATLFVLIKKHTVLKLFVKQ